MALLAVLALARGRPVTRDRISGLLWPESGAERARPQLSDTLYILRSALNEDVVRSVGDGLVLNPDAITSDVAQFEGLLDVKALERALQEIVRRHDALRTTFPSQRGLPSQRIMPAEAFVLDVQDLTGHAAEPGDVALEALITTEIRRPFDLGLGPIFRVRLLRLAPDRHVLIGAVHHIVFDAWSNGIFFRELTTLYRAFTAGEPSPLPEPPIRFVDFAAWQRARTERPASSAGSPPTAATTALPGATCGALGDQYYWPSSSAPPLHRSKRLNKLNDTR